LKTTFGSAAVESEIVDVQSTPAALAVVPSNEIVSDDFFDGDINPDDVRAPKLELTHGVGFGPKEGFLPGSLVFDRSIVLATPTKTEILAVDAITVYPLKAVKSFIEDIPKEDYEKRKEAKDWAKRFKTEQEARAAGFVSTKQRRDGLAEHAFRPELKLTVLVEANKLGGDQLPLEYEGKKYVVAEFTLSKGQYYGCGTAFENHASSCKLYRLPFYSKGFKITAGFYKSNPLAKDPNWNLKAAPGPMTSPAFIAWIKERFAV
jgi:hypothetical protein